MSKMENMEAFLIKNACVPNDEKVKLDFNELKKSMEQMPIIKKVIESNLNEKEKK